MKLAIKIIKTPGLGYQAWCPALPGCSVVAISRDQAWERIQTAVQGYLASMDVALPRELGRQFKNEQELALTT